MEYTNKNDKIITSTKPITSYPENVLADIKLVTFEKDKLATPFGSFIYRIQKYPGDVDLLEEFTECCNTAEVIAKFARRLRKMVKLIESKKTHFFSEFKAGEDSRFDVDIGRLESGIYFPNEKLKKISDNLFRKALLPENEFSAINDILINGLKQKLTGDDYDIVYNIFREHKILRWTVKEILSGNKK